jgi:hypothetical protein
MWRWTPISEGIRFDGHTLVVRIRMPFQRRGRKHIVAPNGSGFTVATKPQPDGALMKALGRAWRWQKLLDDGVHGSVSEIGDAESISKSYVRCGNRAGLRASAEGGHPPR